MGHRKGTEIKRKGHTVTVLSSTDSFHFITFSSSSSSSPLWQPRKGVPGPLAGAPHGLRVLCPLGPHTSCSLLPARGPAGDSVRPTRAKCSQGATQPGGLTISLGKSFSELLQFEALSARPSLLPASSSRALVGLCQGLRPSCLLLLPPLDPLAPDTSCRSSPALGSGSWHLPPTHLSSSSSFFSLSPSASGPLFLMLPAALLWSPSLFCRGRPCLALGGIRLPETLEIKPSAAWNAT